MNTINIQTVKTCTNFLSYISVLDNLQKHSKVRLLSSIDVSNFMGFIPFYNVIEKIRVIGCNNSDKSSCKAVSYSKSMLRTEIHHHTTTDHTVVYRTEHLPSICDGKEYFPYIEIKLIKNYIYLPRKSQEDFQKYLTKLSNFTIDTKVCKC